MANIIINLRHKDNPINLTRHIFTDVNLQKSVKDLKSNISEIFNIPQETLYPTCFGNSLQDDQSLDFYGITSGSLINVYQMDPSASAGNLIIDENPQQPDVIGLKAALKPLLNNHSFISMFRKDETIDMLLAALPTLANDYVAVCILQDVDMIKLIATPGTLEKIITEHPILAEALHYAIRAFQEEASKAPGPSSDHVSYSLDSISDDEMDEGPSGGPITHAHLATALANAVASANVGGAPPSTITSAMFSEAMQNALGAITPASMQSQLQQLREMGIEDEAVSLQALEATGGDVNAALELIFGLDFIERPEGASM